jgi:hypothetical protein
MKRSRVIRVSALALAFSAFALHTVSANIFGDIANHIGNALTGAGKVVGAPFGGFLQGATDPVIDGAADKFKEVASQAADRLDQSLNKENISVENIAATSIATLNTTLNATISAQLDRVDKIANSALDREANILDSTVSNVDALVTKDIEKVQNIETDAFDRVDGVIDDEVPFAVGEIAHEVVYMSVTIIFLVVLVGFVGAHLLDRYKKKPSAESLLTWLNRELRPVPGQVLLVSVPMVLVSALILTAYEGYHLAATHSLISRLEAASAVLEQAGDYKAAGEFRRRAFALVGSAQRDYFYRRDIWMADFTQAHKLNPIDIVSRLGSIESTYGPGGTAHSDFETEDGELLGASIYIQARYQNQFDQHKVDDFKARFLTGKDSTSVPFTGKLVLACELIAAVDNQQQPVLLQRMNAAQNILNELGALYPKYAMGQILMAEQLGARSDMDRLGLTPTSEQATSAIEKNIDSATAEDRNLVSAYLLNNIQVPDALMKEIADPGKAADAETQLNALVENTLLPVARSIYGSETLSRAVVLRRTTDAVKRARDVDALNAAVTAARGASRSDPNKASALLKYLDVAERAERLNLLLVSEQWLTEVKAVQQGSAIVAQPDIDRINSLTGKLKQATLSFRLFQL